MTLRERILAVYRGQAPDVVPYMLDLSHWFYHRHHMPWDLSKAYYEPERELVEYHRRIGVGFYIANLAPFYEVSFPDEVRASVERDDSDGLELVWRYETPIGSIERRRRWSEQTYSWHISRRGVRTEHDLRVLGYALGRRRFRPAWERYRAWADCVGKWGEVYISTGYTALGYLLGYWMPTDELIYATVDWPEVMQEVVEQINDCWLGLIDLLARSPAEVIITGDNFSSDVQSPPFMERWSRPWYAEAVRRLHAAGKKVAVHVDGQLRGLLGEFAEMDMDCIDAVTPAPMGDLTPRECREEAGRDLILSGGIPPNLWLPERSEDEFRRGVLEWLKLARTSPRLICAAGDQVPPGAVEERIALARDLVEEHGRL